MTDDKLKAAEEYVRNNSVYMGEEDTTQMRKSFLAGADWAMEKMRGEMKFSCTCPECSDNENTLEALRKDG